MQVRDDIEDRILVRLEREMEREMRRVVEMGHIIKIIRQNIKKLTHTHSYTYTSMIRSSSFAGWNFSNNEDEEEKLPLSQDSTTQPLLSCSVLPNGPHQLGLCSVDYIICRDGTTRLASCPEPLVFSPDSSQCDFRVNVIACRKKAEATGNEAGL